MDAVDRSIIFAANENCRISYEELARRVKLTPNAVKNRVNNLINKGVLYQFHITYDPSEIGAESFQAVIQTDGKETPSQFVAAMGENPLIGHVCILATVKGGAYLIWGQFFPLIL